jgi:hypothetical protein
MSGVVRSRASARRSSLVASPYGFPTIFRMLLPVEGKELQRFAS